MTHKSFKESAMPKIVDKEQMQADILDAALGCFGELGVHQTRMSDVASTLGIVKGTLYRYYASKEALLAALVERQLSAQEDAYRARAVKVANADDVLTMVGTMFDVARAHSAAIKLFFDVLQPGLAAPPVQARVTAFFDGVAHELALGFRGAFPELEEPRAQTLAQSMAAMIDGVIVRNAVLGLDEQQWEAIVHEILSVFRSHLNTFRDNA